MSTVIETPIKPSTRAADLLFESHDKVPIDLRLKHGSDWYACASDNWWGTVYWMLALPISGYSRRRVPSRLTELPLWKEGALIDQAMERFVNTVSDEGVPVMLSHDRYGQDVRRTKSWSGVAVGPYRKVLSQTDDLPVLCYSHELGVNFHIAEFIESYTPAYWWVAASGGRLARRLGPTGHIAAVVMGRKLESYPASSPAVRF